MPIRYTAPGGPRKLEFWIRSSRGTDARSFVHVPAGWSTGEIKSELEEWCSTFACWSMGESMMRYGWNDEKDYGKRD
jgi:hypothetical protein